MALPEIKNLREIPLVFRPSHHVAARLALAVAILCVSVSHLVADDLPPASQRRVESSNEIPQRPAAADFKPLLQEWKATLGELRAVQQKYQQADDAGQRKQLQAEFEALLTTARSMIPRLRVAGRGAYDAAPNDDPELTRFLYKLAEDELAGDRYDDAWGLGNLLVTKNCGIPAAYNVAGVAAFARNNYDKAEEYLQVAKRRNVLSATGSRLLGMVENYRTLWTEEENLRDQQAGNLPLVNLSTTEGDIICELFEDEAPQTVGNFIYLIEQGFYDGLPFYQVVSGQRASIGCPEGDGTGGPGYKIYSECYRDNHRNHFRGSLSMDTGGKRDTGGSRFFFTFLPNPELNGRNTVFGRVVEGMDVLERLQRTDSIPRDPASSRDKIIEATVIKKQEGKKYLPVKVKE